MWNCDTARPGRNRNVTVENQGRFSHRPDFSGLRPRRGGGEIYPAQSDREEFFMKE
jgi:hypothetical protein